MMHPFPRVPGRRFLHSPGPSHVPEEVNHAISRQPIDMGDPRLDVVIASCERSLRTLLGTQAADVFMYAGNGHGAWEAVIVNLLEPGQSVLVPGTGNFSAGWAEQCTAMGARVIGTPWIEGAPIDAAVVEQLLRDDREHAIVAVFAVHTDTASSVTSDIAALRKAIDAAGHPALLVVDVVASLGAVPFAMDELGVNVVLGASQKGLMCPPGLGFAAADARAMAVCEQVQTPRFYWDWRLRKSPFAYRKFCGTPPQTLLFGLEVALRLILEEGIDQVLQRHRLVTDLVHAAVSCWSHEGVVGFFVTDPAVRSTAVTTISVADGVDVEALRAVARERFQVSIAGGLGPLQGRVFRIGHLGDINAGMVMACLAGVQAAMAIQGIRFGPGALDAAAARLARG